MGRLKDRRFWKGLALDSLLAVMGASLLVACGCTKTPTGVRVTATAVSATNIADVNYDEYKWPVLSIYTGPKVVMWINKDFAVLKSVRASGCVTNDTTALGVYSSREQKQASVELTFTSGTNIVVDVEN